MRIYDNEEISSAVALLKGLADPTRLRIMALLAHSGELCVCQIHGALGESQYKVSRHLGVLRQAGWVEEHRRGRWVHYSPALRGRDLRENLAAALRSLPMPALRLAVAPERLGELKKECSPGE